jgi:altronate dehydratase
LAVVTEGELLGERPLPVRSLTDLPDFQFPAWRTKNGLVNDRIGLILPTSLCSGQIARMAVQQLNESEVGKAAGISHFATLVHTEGCGSSTQAEYLRTMLGYLAHPSVARCLLLEHGCEKTHNDFWRQQIGQNGLDAAQFGWASVQGDGGIANSLAKMVDWCAENADEAESSLTMAGLADVRLALLSEAGYDEETAVSLAKLAQWIVAGGGTVIILADDPLLQTAALAQLLEVETAVTPTLNYAQPPATPGLHIMTTPSHNWAELLSGL